MFAKLKKKLHEEGGEIPSVSGTGPGIASPVNKDRTGVGSRRTPSPGVLRKNSRSTSLPSVAVHTTPPKEKGKKPTDVPTATASDIDLNSTEDDDASLEALVTSLESLTIPETVETPVDERSADERPVAQRPSDARPVVDINTNIDFEPLAVHSSKSTNSISQNSSSSLSSSESTVSKKEEIVIKKEEIAVKKRETATGDHKEFQEKVSFLEGQIERLEQCLEDEKRLSEQKIAKFELQIEESFARELEREEHCKKLEIQNNEYQGQLLEAEKRIQELTQELEGQNKQTSNASDEIQTLQKDLSKARLEIASSHRSTKKFQEDLVKLNKETDRLMLRNAELSQQVERLNQQLSGERRDAERDLNEKLAEVDAVQIELSSYKEKVKQLEEEKEYVEVRNGEISQLTEHKQRIEELESQITEKNKANKMLQQRLTDLKKTLQRELKVQSLPNDTLSTPPMERSNNYHSKQQTSVFDGKDQGRPPERTTHKCTTSCSNGRTSNMEDDVNFKYLKHVVLKFMLSRETEALHLVKAIATLLKFSKDETNLIKETLEWKTSWFKIKPQLGKGQLAKEIPASY